MAISASPTQMDIFQFAEKSSGASSWYCDAPFTGPSPSHILSLSLFEHQPAALLSLWNGALFHHTALLACSLFHSSFFFFFKLLFPTLSLFPVSGWELIWEAQLPVGRPQRAWGHNRPRGGKRETLANMATTRRDFIYVKSTDTLTFTATSIWDAGKKDGNSFFKCYFWCEFYFLNQIVDLFFICYLDGDNNETNIEYRNKNK